MYVCRETLPLYYDKNIIGFLPQSPDTLFVYWELSLSHWQAVDGMGSFLVRLYSVRENSDSDFEYILAGEVQQPPFTESWYFTGLQPGAMYLAEIGVKLPDGNFYSMVKSETALTPPLPRSDITPRSKPAADRSLEKPTVNPEDESFRINELKMGLDEVFQEMPFYMGYDTQLAG